MLSRRDFLKTSGVVALGAAATACSSGGSNGEPSGSKTFDEIIAGRTQTLQYIGVGTELLSRQPERLTFGIAQSTGLVVGAEGELWIAADRNAAAQGPFPIVERGDGLPPDRSFYAAEVTFPTDGTFQVLVDVKVDGEERFAAGMVQIGRTMQMPMPGDQAIVTPTPTPEATMGVDPICTRRPPCGMHEVSLDDALERGDKVFLSIATPAFCTSKLCGPEIDMIEETRKGFEDLTFIHIEVLANDDTETVQRFGPLSPAALAWKLEQEPAIYAIGSDGKIDERWLGPVDRTEITGIAERLSQA
ncbi:MAG: twin-arginine translocation signal domain-containing protein [Actinomycetota bacterium]